MAGSCLHKKLTSFFSFEKFININGTMWFQFLDTNYMFTHIYNFYESHNLVHGVMSLPFHSLCTTRRWGFLNRWELGVILSSTGEGWDKYETGVSVPVRYSWVRSLTQDTDVDQVGTGSTMSKTVSVNQVWCLGLGANTTYKGPRPVTESTESLDLGRCWDFEETERRVVTRVRTEGTIQCS